MFPNGLESVPAFSYSCPVNNPGFLFMFGVYGTRPTRETVSLLKDTGACGVLLLARNIESARQARAFTEELTQRVGRPLLFAVDHEGGWVLRFKDGVTAFPGNAALGRAGDPRLAYATGRQMALELSRLGIRLNLAPVLDVLTERYNPGIGMRSFGRDPALVSRLGSAFIKGLQDHGVSACAKHFPGKGAASVDAHVELPTIRIPRPEFERVHLAPFAEAVKAGVRCVMTSHVRFPALDRVPATFSRRITRGLLRDKLGFEGVVISDDLCMGAVTADRPIQTAAVQALEAGHDMLIIAHDRQAQREAAGLLAAAVEGGRIGEEDIRLSRTRIEKLVARPRKPAAAADLEEGISLSALVSDKAIELVQQGAITLPVPSNGRPNLVLLPDFREVKDRFTFEQGPSGPERWLRGTLAHGNPARLLRAPVQSKEVSHLREEVRRASRIVFFCFEAMRFPGQRAVLELLKKEAPERTVVCLIRNSWDRAKLDRRMTALDAHGYRLCQLSQALARMLPARKS